MGAPHAGPQEHPAGREPDVLAHRIDEDDGRFGIDWLLIREAASLHIPTGQCAGVRHLQTAREKQKRIRQHTEHQHAFQPHEHPARGGCRTVRRAANRKFCIVTFRYCC